MRELKFEPLIPPAIWVALAVAGLGVLVWYAMRRPVAVRARRWNLVIVLMGTALLLVLGLSLNPTWSTELPPPPGKPVLYVLLDATGSMATPDVQGQPSRYAAAAQLTGKFASSLSNRFDVRVRTFDEHTRTSTPESAAAREPDGKMTDLAAALSDCLVEEHAAGEAIVLLSDGINNAPGGTTRVLEAVRTAKALAAPVYTRTFGGDVSTLDLAVELRSPQDMAIVGQKLPLTARVTHVGMVAGHAAVTLLQDGKEIARRDAAFEAGGSTDVHFLVSQEKVGLYPYEVRVEPLAGETSQANNTASYVLRVVDEPIRVLVLEGKPYWDSKFFTRTVADDPAVALDSYVKLSDARILRRTLSHNSGTTQPAAAGQKDPAGRVETWKIITDRTEILGNPDKLRGYQIVMLGRDAEAFLDDAAVVNLQSWISQQGGSLVCYRGAPTADGGSSTAANDRLARLLPVRWTPASAGRFRLSLTDEGKNLNWFAAAGGPEAFASLPSLAGTAAVQTAKPLAVVLASTVTEESSRAPAISYQPYGTGRVVCVEGAGMWRWAFLPPQYQDQEQVYSSLWHSMMRWLTSGTSLTPGQTLSLRADKIRYESNESATATLLAREEEAGKLPAIELLGDGPAAGKRFAPAPVGSETGVFRVNFGPLAEGRYQARIAGSKAEDPTARIVFDVRNYDQEKTDLRARPDLMARIATDSGGAVLGASGGASQVATEFGQHLDRIHPPRFERSTAWDRWWILLAVLGMWGLSWTVRRSGGLV